VRILLHGNEISLRKSKCSILTGLYRQRYPASPHARDPQSRGISITALQFYSGASVRIKTYVVQRSISANGAPLVQIIHLAHDRSDSARAQACRAAPDELSKRAEELALGECSLEREEMREDADDHQELLCRIALHEREERGVEYVGAFDLVCVLSEEEHTFVD
jgi:hypothetical protein